MKYYLIKSVLKYHNVTLMNNPEVPNEGSVVSGFFYFNPPKEIMQKKWMATVDIKGKKLHWHMALNCIYISKEMREGLKKQCGDDIEFLHPEVKELDYPVFIPIIRNFVPLERELSRLDNSQSPIERDWSDEINWITTPLGKRLKKFSSVEYITIKKDEIKNWTIFHIDDNPGNLIVNEEVRDVIENFDYIEVNFERINVI